MADPQNFRFESSSPRVVDITTRVVCRSTGGSSLFIELVGLTIESSQPFEVLNLNARFGH